MPVPAAPTRGYSFTGHSTNNPGTPQPGDRLDTEFDRTNAAVANLIGFVRTSLTDDGAPKPGIIGTDQLAPGIVDGIVSQVTADVSPDITAAQTAAGSAQSSATTAAGHASTAAGHATAAAAARTDAETARDAAVTAKTASETARDAATVARTAAENARNGAAGSEARAELLALLTEAWAEHLSGPIPPGLLAETGVTGDHWSARFWANQAAMKVAELRAGMDGYMLAVVHTAPWVFNGVNTSFPLADENGVAIVPATPNDMIVYLGGVLQRPGADYTTDGASITFTEAPPEGFTVYAAIGVVTTNTTQPVLAAVATTGSYADLSGRPTLATVATSGQYNDLSGRPTLATVATTGSYADLSDKPAIPAAIFDLSLFVAGKPANGEVVLRYGFTRTVSFPPHFAGSQATAGTAPTASATFTIARNGAAIGTLVFTGATSAYTLAGGATFNAGDVLVVTAPATADATLADLAVTFAGVR